MTPGTRASCGWLLCWCRAFPSLAISRRGWSALRAARWPLRTLLLYAGDDRLVSPRGSRAFAQAAAPAGPRVRSECFAALYHEIFNEPDAAPVFAALAAWLDGAD